MTERERHELLSMEEQGNKSGWVMPMEKEDKAYLAHFRAVCKRYNIVPSKANRLEYDFVTKVADSEFYLQKADVSI